MVLLLSATVALLVDAMRRSCRRLRHARRRSVRVRAVLLAFSVASVGVLVAPSAPANAVGATCRGVRATLVGTPSSEVIHGTPGRDVIAGLGGNDTILAGGGDDLVCGGEGADHLNGGAGKDWLYGGKDLLANADEDGIERIGDTLRGGSGDDRLHAGSDRRSADIVVPDVFSWEGSARGVHIDLREGTSRGQGVDTFAGGSFSIVGSAHGDVVTGSDRRDRIDTGPGPDVVRARGGDDIIAVDGTHRGFGGEADQVWGGRGDDRITALGGQDRLSGGRGHDWIEASRGGNDILLGGRGRDVLYAEIADSAGPQTFNGGRGSDFLQLNSDAINHTWKASTGAWNMATGDMTFTLEHQISLTASHIEQVILATRSTSWTVTGTSGDDEVFGDANSVSSPVTFDGLDGDDLFRGTDGDDVFDGGAGVDHSVGMLGGDDTCISVEIIDGSDCEHVS